MQNGPRNVEDVENALLRTLTYTDQFDFPLTADELRQRFLGDEKRDEISSADFQRALKNLVNEKKIAKREGVFALFGRESIFETRKRRGKIAQQKWREVNQFVEGAKYLPWVRAIFVTGSLAMMNTEAADDLDFMIIVEENRLWITRLLLLCWATAAGKRRSWQEKTHQGWCLNLWLDEKHLGVAASKRGVYQAYEVMQAKPIFNREKTVERFYAANAWVKDFLPNWETSEGDVSDVDYSAQTWSFLSHFFNYMDFLAWKIQAWYMHPHQTTEKVGRGFAFFHPRSTELLIQKGWQASLQSVKHERSTVQSNTMLPDDVRSFLDAAREKKQLVVFATGVFDILHQEHKNFLRKAKNAGDVLLVAIESDVRVRKMKGEGRPVNTQLVRKKNLEKLGIADKVFILPEDFSRPDHHDQLIREVRPALLAVSSHTAHQPEKKKIVEKYGGELRIVHEFNPEISTTKILESHRES